MKSSVFRYPYEKVFRRTHNALARWGMKIKNADAMRGFIQAESGFSLTKPSMKVDLMVEEMDNHDTKVTITGISVRKALFGAKKDVEESEVRLLEKLETNF